jgi:signal peptidase I
VELRNEVLWVNGEIQPISFLPARVGDDGETILLGTETLQGAKVPVRHPVRILPERAALRTFGPIVVPEDEVFLMGDNRDESRDGRFFGTRPVSDLLGRGVGVMWSWNQEFLKGPRWNRFGRKFITEAPSAGS